MHLVYSDPMFLASCLLCLVPGLGIAVFAKEESCDTEIRTSKLCITFAPVDTPLNFKTPNTASENTMKSGGALRKVD